MRLMLIIFAENKVCSKKYFVDVIDNVYVTKSVINPVNKKFADPCKSLIYRGLQFGVVVPPGKESYGGLHESPIR